MTSITLKWPKKKITDRQITNIVQIRYFVKEKANGDSFIDVWARNIFLKDDDESKIYFWAKMPLVYENHLKRAFYRLDLLSYFAQWEGGDDEFKTTIKENLVYLDYVLDETWKAAARANMHADWRSDVFDMWLSIEGRVGHHDPDSVHGFIEENGLSDLEEDAFEIRV
jgi:hypothetical protein